MHEPQCFLVVPREGEDTYVPVIYKKALIRYLKMKQLTWSARDVTVIG